MFDLFELYDLLVVSCIILSASLIVVSAIHYTFKGTITEDTAFVISFITAIIMIFILIKHGHYYHNNRPKESILRQFNRVDPSITVTSYDDETNTANIAINKTEKYSPYYVITEKMDPSDPRISACRNGNKELLQWRENSDGFGGIIVRIKCDPLQTK